MKLGNIFMIMLIAVIILNQRVNGMQFFGWSSAKSYGCGALIYGKEKLKNIFHNGSVTLNETTVSGTVQVNGHFDAKKSNIAELDINGSVAMDGCIIEGQATVNGSVKAQNSRFQKLLSIASEQVYINSSVIQELKIKKVGGFEGTQVVELHNATKVLGPISFESGKGEVVLYDASEIGRIYGGTVSRR